MTNGLFTVTLNFGAGVFTGTNYWLDIGVRTNGISGFGILSPRQKLTPAPYAIYSGTAASAANLSGTLPASQLSGTVPSAQFSGTYGNVVTLTNAANSFTGNGTGLTSVNAALLGGFERVPLLANGRERGRQPRQRRFPRHDGQPAARTPGQRFSGAQVGADFRFQHSERCRRFFPQLRRSRCRGGDSGGWWRGHIGFPGVRWH